MVGLARWAGTAAFQRRDPLEAPFKEHAPTIVNPKGSASLRRRGRPSGARSQHIVDSLYATHR